MDLNLFENKKIGNDFIDKFIVELKMQFAIQKEKIKMKRVTFWMNIMYMKKRRYF